MPDARTRVVVIDMQPITPAVGGGRQRLLGLYHALGDAFETTYVGTYDWPGESARDLQLTPTLREICVPLDAAHHAAASALSARLGGATVVDSAFATQAHLSQAWRDAAVREIARADIVVFSHPWCFPPLAHALKPSQFVVYDSHNVEGLLKGALLGFEGDAEALVRDVVAAEHAACARADLVLACSFEDVDGFGRIYDVPADKLRVVPNGAFTDRFASLDAGDVRSAHGLAADRTVAVFLGSRYGPNEEAARYIAGPLASAMPDVTFAIVGGVGDAVQGERAPNVVVTGVVDEAVRDAWLLAADVALNPMSAGSGTNVKMFDFLAAGLPVVTTPIGARGICDAASAPPFIRVVSLDEFPARIAELSAQREQWGDAPAAYARTHYSFERISAELGAMLRAESERRRVAPAARGWVFGSWNVQCGIGEHTAYFVQALDRAGVRTTILGNRLEGHTSVDLRRDLERPVVRLWTWDNKHWRDSGVDIGRLQQLIATDGAPAFAFVQHHTGFMPGFEFERLVQALRDAGVPTIIELHDARNVEPNTMAAMARAGATILFHDEEEMRRFTDVLGGRGRVLHHPVHAGAEAAAIGADDGDGAPIIGGFGFLRPYKGVIDSIRTVAQLQERFPGIRYHGWHAMYGDRESVEYHAACLAEAHRLGIGDRVEIDTRFLAVEEIIAALRGVDAVLLPYAASQEGASGAANLALAAGRAIVVSRSAIFRSIASVAEVVAEGTPTGFAKATSRLLADPAARAQAEARSRAWAQGNSYDAAARTLLALAAPH